MQRLNPQPNFWTIAEYIAIATSVLGSLLSAISGQTLYATVPISLALLLNLFNRNQLQQESRNNVQIENANGNQLDSSFQSQTRTDSNLALTLFEVLERIEKVPEVSQAVNEVTQKIESLKSEIEKLPKQQALETISNKFDNRSEPKEIIEIKQALTNLQDDLDTKIEETFVKTKDLITQIPSYSQYKYELVSGRFEGRKKLLGALKESKTEIIMVCPWITLFALELEVGLAIESSLEKGVQINIGWGYLKDIDDLKKRNVISQISSTLQKQDSYKGIAKLNSFQQNYKNLHLKLMGTHEKFLVCDHSWALITSHNFLSAGDTNNNNVAREIGLVTYDPYIINSLVDLYNNAPDLS